MKHCPHCNVDIKTKRKTCPLCYDVLEDAPSESETPLQKYPKKNVKHHLTVVEKIGLFVSIVVVLASFIVNYMTFKLAPYYWSIVVAFAVPYLWLLIRYVIMGRGLLTTRIFSAGLTSAILVIVVEFAVCFVKKIADRQIYWSLNYVLPSILVATILAIVIICIVNRDLYVDSIIMLFALAFITFILYILLLVTNWFVVDWAIIGTAVIGLSTIIGMFIFAFKDTKEELEKRFHIK